MLRSFAPFPQPHPGNGQREGAVGIAFRPSVPVIESWRTVGTSHERRVATITAGCVITFCKSPVPGAVFKKIPQKFPARLKKSGEKQAPPEQKETKEMQ